MEYQKINPKPLIMNNPNLIPKKDKAYYARERSWPALFSIKEQSKVLDIGCGQGNLGAFLKQTFGCHVTGLDIIDENVQIARKVLDIVIMGDIETMDLNEVLGPYDYIIFSDCLEHLLDPEKVLFRILRLLNSKDGELLISIPNVRNFKVTLPLLLKDEWQYTDEGLLDKTHLRFFTLKSIKRLLSHTGYQVNQVKFNLPISSKSGVLNQFTFGLFRNHQ